MQGLIILIKLLCAHLFADFVLQTDKLHKGKAVKGGKGFQYQLLHSFIHACTAYIFVADWSAWIIPIVIFVSHFIIDSIKYRKANTGITSFLMDQLAHILVIVAMWYLMFGNCADLCG